MKQLQNNFTTPEQSKRLLELGVPADSADVPMIVFKDGTYIYKEVLKDKTLSDYQGEDDAFQDEQDYPSYVHYCPCWSVGRLIEIFIICTPFTEIRLRTNCVYSLMASFEDVCRRGLIDFSKLED